MTGNAGLFYVCWQLTRRGWNILPTIRNARGADLYAVDPEHEDRTVPIQSKALSKRNAIALGASLERLRSTWWIITVGANQDVPECFILHLEEVRARATRDKGGDRHYWLEAKDYMLPEFRDAWDRIREN